VLIGAAVVSALLRAFASGDLEQFSTVTQLDGILVGCAAALAGWRTRSPWAGVALIAVAAMAPWPRLWVFDAGIAVAVVGSVVLVTGARTGLLSHPALVWLGSISYALYLWHLPLLTGTGLHPLVAVPLAVLIAYGSTRFIEAPFRRLRRPFAGTPDPERVSPARPA
jgi:peptidoglycan/LPS O-acetylase OafA/YrhL